MDKATAIAHYGSASKLARALGVKPAAVITWQEIPRLRQYQLEVLTEGKLKADRTQVPARTHHYPKQRKQRAAEAPRINAKPRLFTLSSDEVELLAKGEELGVLPQEGERWADYRARVQAATLTNAG